MAPVVGYVGRITAADLETVDPENYLASTNIGKTGIENYYEKTLHGTIGTNTNEINASGHTIRSVSRIQAVSGKNIPLNQLTYWNVELQEAYFSPKEAQQRYEELNKK